MLADRVKETSTTTGTGTLSLDGAASGYQTFVAGIGNGNTCYYLIEHGADWEVGIGTVTDASPDTLSRDTVLQSSNADALVNFGAGTKDVLVVYPADKAVYKDANDDIATANSILIQADNESLVIGAGGDAKIYYNGADLWLNPRMVGSGRVKVDGSVYLVLSDADPTGLYIDGTTNDFATSGAEIKVIKAYRDVNYGTGNFAGSLVIDQQIRFYNTAAVLASDAIVYAMYNELVGDSTNKIVNASTSNRYYYSYTIGSKVTDESTYDTEDTGRFYYYPAGYTLRLNLYPTFTDSGGVAAGGARCVATGFNCLVRNQPTLSSGTLFASSRGLYVDVQGNTAGNSIAFGLYINVVSGADTNWAIYQADTGVPSFLDGPLGIGSTGVPTANADKVLWFGDNGGQPTMASNTAGLYGYDSGSGTVELWVVDEAGNDTQVSAHNPTLYEPDADDPLPWTFHHRNRFLGIGQQVDMSGLVRAVERLTGRKFAYTYRLPPGETLDPGTVRRQQAEAHETSERLRRAAYLDSWIEERGEGGDVSYRYPTDEEADAKMDKRKFVPKAVPAWIAQRSAHRRE